MEGVPAIVHIHGDILNATGCILTKKQYIEAYGNKEVELTKSIPRFLANQYERRTLLFIGCSLNRDRTIEVFRTVKNTLRDEERPQHFSLESMPEDEKELTDRNRYLLNIGITPIWFPNDQFDFVERILRCARNELGYRGYLLKPSNSNTATGDSDNEVEETVPVYRTESINATPTRIIFWDKLGRWWNSLI
jgi:hypothetical protein